MTLTIKDPPESASPGKPGAPSQNSENGPGQFSRSNPVCLEVVVTIRSLPTEAGTLAQSIREEGRTVIVFENGAVLRTANNLPVGQSVILSNPNGRDVVCRVVGGRNLPTVKGYAEVEFIEPAKDFWGIHRDVDSVAVAAPPAAPLIPREPAAVPPSAPIRAAVPLQTAEKPSATSLGRGPTFEDIPGLLSVPASTGAREPKTPSARPAPEKLAKDESGYNLSEIAQSTSVANWRPPDSNLPADKRAIAAMRDALSTSAPVSTSAPSRDFMGKGLMAYGQPRPSSEATIGRTPLVLGVAVLILAAAGAVVFFVYRGTSSASVAKTDVVSQPFTPEAPAAKSAPQHAQAQKDESAQVAAQSQTKTGPQQVAVDQAQPAAAFAPIPAVVTRPETADSRTGPGNDRRQEEDAVVPKQPNLTSSRRPAIPNLKIGSPSAPNQIVANLGDAAAPMTDIASTEALEATPPAGLLTSAGRASTPPAPPPSAPAPAPVAAVKTVRDPKLISSPRLVYPTVARQSGVQGSVMVSANIDENGKVVGAKALSGPMLLRQAAVDSVKQWRYSPGLIDGKPAPSQVTVSVEFQLH